MTQNVYRIYVEKKPGLTHEASALFQDIRSLLPLPALTGLRIVNRYDVQRIDEELFRQCCYTVFSEPQQDLTYDKLEAGEGEIMFAVEYLPGQFDQRADSAAQCVQIISQGERPLVRTAKVYLLQGDLTAEDIAAVKKCSR